jgi:hypothetical protein
MTERAVLRKEYDLSYRPRVGATTFHRMGNRNIMGMVYRNIDERGLVATRESYSGDFRRVVDSVEPSGRAIETITWTNICRRWADGDQDYGPAEKIDWAEGFEYTFSGEGTYDDFYAKLDITDFPRDLLGWMAFVLVVDAHFEFDFLRSDRHGAISKLRRIGDTVVAPDTGEAYAISFLPLIDVPAFTKRNLRTTFAGFTVCNGADCALLTFDMDPSPFTILMGENEINSVSSFAGTLTARLDDGVLEHGEFLEWVFNDMGVCISPVYTIRRMQEADSGGPSDRPRH